MSVTIKNPEERDGMRAAGKAAASVLTMIAPHVKAGVTTEELDRICHDYIVDTLKGVPAPLGYGGGGGRMPFPKSICTSINHVVCHGIPANKALKRGDVINIDITVIKDGWHGDTSQMFYIGEP
ncbi:MAG: M24 family metallopeptidase, partial [Nevskia sp.]